MNKPVVVFGCFHSPTPKGQIHETTYLEYQIPLELEEELSKIVEEKIKQFEANCQCVFCKEERNIS